MRFIALHGRAHAGKDTIAGMLVQQHDFSRVSFAGPIKDGLIAMFGLSRAELEDDRKEKPVPWLGVSPRRLMQTLGTEWGRNMIRDDLWIALADRRIAQMRKYGTRLVITDVRFENEAAWIRRIGGEIWHVLRPQASNVVPLHASEDGIRLLAGADSVIDNSEGLEQLAGKVRAALEGERIVQGFVR